MATFREAVSQAIRDGYCGTVRREPRWFAGLRRLVVDPDSGLGDAARTFNRLVCNSSDEPEDDYPPPPFEGGQCSGVTYRVTASGTNTCLGGSSAQAFATGPIQGLSVGNGAGATACDGSPSRRVFIVRNGGLTAIGPANLKASDAATWAITSVERLDAAPDTCGDPPIEFPDPEPITVNPPDITYEGDDNISVTVPIALVYAPVTIRANAELSIPVTVDVGGLEFNANLELFPDFAVKFFPDAVFNAPGTPDDPDLTDPEPGSEGEDEPEDEPPDVDHIVAVVVRSNKDGNTRASEVAQDALPTLYAPRLGNVSFRVRTGPVTSWTPPQPIQFADQHIPCPSPYGAIAVNVWWDAGWTGSFTPIRGKPLGEI